MDIQIYEDIFDGLKEYNDKLLNNYGNIIVPFPSTSKYPNTVFKEIRNVANSRYNTRYDKVSSIGYRVDIYAKTKGSIDKQTIARQLMKYIDDYLTYTVGLLQVSYNAIDLENDASIYQITLTYSAYFYENRRTIM